MSNEFDHRRGDGTFPSRPDAIPSRAGAGKVAARVYGAHNSASDDPGTQPEGRLPFMDVLAGAGAVQRRTDDRADGDTVTRGQLDAAREKDRLIDAYKDILATKFDSMRAGVQSTCNQLEHRAPKKTDLLGNMINMAATAAVAGAAGVVAELVARRLAAGVAEGFETYKQVHQRFATDSLKEHLKKSFRVGANGAKGDFLDELKWSFLDAQTKKIQAAEIDFLTQFGTHTGGQMAELPIEVLRAAVDHAKQEALDPEVSAAASRNAAVEWANLVAQLHHGDGAWDYWAGPLGSPHAESTLDSAGAPHHSNDPDSHPSESNVSSESDSIRDLVDDDQRKFNPASHGMLEIDLWGTDFEPGHGFRGFEVFTRFGSGMRIGGVSAHVKQMIAQYRQVRDLKMNKIVTVYSARGNRLNPPKPDGRMLITADGYIRRWTTDGDATELHTAASFAQDLSPAGIL